MHAENKPVIIPFKVQGPVPFLVPNPDAEARAVDHPAKVKYT